jgi:branched-chain amino acid transport system permease protein
MFSRTLGRRSLAIALLAILGALMFGSTARAQDDGSSIFGSLDYEDTELEEEIVVEGAVITVESADGFSETATSDAEGAFSVTVPGDGEYVVTLDEETLPEGINLRNPDANPLETQVNDGNDRRVLFSLIQGEGGDSGTSTFSVRRV